MSIRLRRPVAPVEPELLEEAIQGFLEKCRQPVLQEEGVEAIVLVPGRFEFSTQAGRLHLFAWDDVHNWNRRIVAVAGHQTGRLTLVVEKFGAKQGEAWIFDAERPELPLWNRQGERKILREQFRTMLRRTFVGWEIYELSTEQNLQHTLSGGYPRALVTQGKRAWAAIIAPPDSPHALSFGLIWLDYIRKRRQPKLNVEGLALFLPQGETQTIALRLRFLDHQKAHFATFAYTPNGHAEKLDAADWGNLQTSLERCQQTLHAMPDWVMQIGGWPHVERVSLAGGTASFRVFGLEFARWRAGELRGGIDDKRLMTVRHTSELRALAESLAAMRTEKGGLLHQRSPEAWLEMRVRDAITTLDAHLQPDPIYGQVPALSGVDRGIADLLAVEKGGRLAVLEIKATEDVHLPLQALDYWMRVAWHAERGEFSGYGYFPGKELSRETPRLLLVAPALEFHPTTETILGYFSSSVAVERFGVGLEWREALRLLFRLHGAARPG